MVQNTGSDSPRSQMAAELASIARLSDIDLIRLIDTAESKLDLENSQSQVMTEFWAEMIHLLNLERARRRQEILELERMYFSS